MNSIFEDEYDTAKIAKLCKVQEAKPNFNYQEPHLNMKTQTPQRIFEALKSFTQTQQYS